jgi:LytS/YehU family sensor histidine kinase
MKARVDPDFLFRMIGDVQRLYRADVDAAEQRLEDFIEYLRAALPQMRGGATTLGEEVRLAAAYVRLHDESFEGRLDATFDVEESLADAQFPPMALLPLVDDALRRASGKLVLKVAARRTGEGLTVTVTDDAGNEAETPALASHERAFVQFFGEGARVIRHPGSVLLVIDHAISTRPHR